MALDALVEACNDVLACEAQGGSSPYAYHGIPFLEFAQDFLLMYRLGKAADVGDECRYADKFQDWIMAAQVWEGAP